MILFRGEYKKRLRYTKAVAKALIFLIAATAFLSVNLPIKVQAEGGNSKKVRVGYYENEVFEEGAEDGAVKRGYAYEYYRKLSEYTGWEYEYVYGGFNELYQQLIDGDIDLLAGLAYREERASIIGYPEAIMGSESYYLVKYDTENDISADPSTMNGKKNWRS